MYISVGEFEDVSIENWANEKIKMRYRNGNVINEHILHDSDMSNIVFK